MRGRAFPLALLTLALAAPAVAAQYSDDPGQQRYGGRGGRMHGMGHGTPPDPVVLQGPPAPADFQQPVQLPEAKLAGYQGLYDRFMTEPEPQRDSLVMLRGTMGDSEDRSSFQQRREIFMPLSQELTRRQAAFDDALKDMLDKNQWKRYEKWRDDQRKAAAQQRQNRRHTAGTGWRRVTVSRRGNGRSGTAREEGGGGQGDGASPDGRHFTVAGMGARQTDSAIDLAHSTGEMQSGGSSYPGWWPNPPTLSGVSAEENRIGQPCPTTAPAPVSGFDWPGFGPGWRRSIPV